MPKHVHVIPAAACTQAAHLQRDLSTLLVHALHARHAEAVDHILGQPAQQPRLQQQQQQRGADWYQARHSGVSLNRACSGATAAGRECSFASGALGAFAAEFHMLQQPPRQGPHLKGTISGTSSVRPLSNRQPKSTWKVSPQELSIRRFSPCLRTAVVVVVVVVVVEHALLSGPLVGPGPVLAAHGRSDAGCPAGCQAAP
jgi:hypothetical protein